MLPHTAGFRSLWPVMIFLPWLLLGLAWLVRSLLPWEKQLARAVRRAPLPPRHAGERGAGAGPAGPRS